VLLSSNALILPILDVLNALSRDKTHTTTPAGLATEKKNRLQRR
jgi:hypothetical protein